jgi:hypothetical protein
VKDGFQVSASRRHRQPHGPELVRAFLISCPGYWMQIQLINTLVKDLGWSDDDWIWSECMDWPDMVDDLLSPEGSCFLSAASRPARATSGLGRPTRDHCDV